MLDRAEDLEAVNLPGWRLHALKGEQAGFWSITASGNWRIIFRFTGPDVELVDYLDYHQEVAHDPHAQPPAPR